MIKSLQNSSFSLLKLLTKTAPLFILFSVFSFSGSAQDRPFITVWKTDNAGTSADNQIIIPGTGTDYLIEWEEVGNEANNNGSETGTNQHTITFPSTGTYRVKISGDFTRITFGGGGDKEKILDIEQWGDLAWNSFRGAFMGCSNLNQTATDAPDLSKVADMSRMFQQASSFNGAIGNWDVSNVIDMYGMFQVVFSFNQDLDSWNVSNVTDMGAMFYRASSFNGAIGNWDVSNVTDMGGMFGYAYRFNRDIGNWNLSAVSEMNGMFREARSFNQDLSSWNVSNVTNMSYMFYNTTSSSSFNQDLGNWNISKVTDFRKMLSYSNINTYNYDQTLIGWAALDSIKTDIVLGANLLDYCLSEEARNILVNQKGWTIEGDSKDCESAFFTSTWKTDNEGISEDNFIVIPLTGTEYTVSWEEVNNTENKGQQTGADYATIAFPQAGTYRIKIYGNISRIDFSDLGDKLKITEIENWGGIQWTSMNTAFAGAENLTISANDAPDLSQVTDMSRMFYNAKSLNQDISHWDVSTITNMSDLFHGASSFNQDLSNWDISNVTKMTRMFANTAAFNQDLNNWNTENVEQMDFMFWDAEAFQGNISDWNTSKVNNMWGMFYGAGSMNTNISNWDVSGVTNMTEMFREAVAFNQDISDWNVANVTDISGMFYDASSFDQNLGSWHLSDASSLFEFLTSAGLSVQNYDSSLEGWATNGNIPSNIALSAEGLNYCASADYRQQLVNDYGWNIIGDITCSLVLESTFPATETTLVEKDTEIYLTFDQEIREINLSGITLKDVSGSQISITDIYIDSLKLHLVHTGLGSNTYEVIIPDSSFVSITGKSNEAISWQFTTQRILSAQDEQSASDHFAYPNPFSDFTYIQFNLPQTQSVNVKVFDLKGQLVREEQYNNLGSGEQSVKFERRNLPAGLYHYQIQSSNGSDGGKMLIK